MIGIDEALALVLEHAAPLPPRVVPRDEALGLVLAEDVASDVDSPPHDKSIVDGYAVVAADPAIGSAPLRILEEVTAGALPAHRVVPGAATRIMTGAPLPEGADAVVMVEQTELLPAAGGLGHVRIHPQQVAGGQNVMRRGASLARGAVVLRAGALLRAIEIGLLAEVGRGQVQAIGRPRLAVLSTGDELIPADEVPGPGQIRNSNEPLLRACAARAGAEARGLGIARDQREHLRQRISEALGDDILVLSGGVSAGVLDLVPAVLQELGVRQVFHKVRLKPGKPLWFGVGDRAGQPPTLVFGLPGNPVSSLVCFELFVRPAIGRLSGREAGGLRRVTARLASAFAHRGQRPTYHPALVRGETVEPLDWAGSSDLAGLTRANALACFPAGDQTYAAGTPIDALLLD